jgi:hypothetical protein
LHMVQVKNSSNDRCWCWRFDVEYHLIGERWFVLG